MRRERGELERAVLEALWDHGGWLTATEVRHRLDAELAQTTIVTVLRRLYGKKVLQRQAEGRGHIYRPLHTRDEHIATAMTELLGNARDPATALNHFVDTLAADDRRQLTRLLRRR